MDLLTRSHLLCSAWSFLQRRILKLTIPDPSIRKICGGTVTLRQNFRGGEIFCFHLLLLSHLLAGFIGIYAQ